LRSDRVTQFPIGGRHVRQPRSQVRVVAAQHADHHGVLRGQCRRSGRQVRHARKRCSNCEVSAPSMIQCPLLAEPRSYAFSGESSLWVSSFGLTGRQLADYGFHYR